MSNRKIKNNASLYQWKTKYKNASYEYNDFSDYSYDLHGMQVQEMVAFVSTKLISLELGDVSSIDFITGVGTGALKLEIEQLFKEHNLKYEIINNGKYRVFS